MLNRSVARRYAEAFFSLAKEQDKIDQYQQELEKIMQVVEDTDHLKEYLAHLLIPAKEKKEIVGSLFAGQLSPTTLKFLYMIIDKRRETYLAAITAEYQDMADESRDIANADLITAQEVPEEEVRILAERLSASTGKTVQFKVAVDPSLIGGVKIRMGDQIIDGTVAKKLAMLKEQLKQVKIS